MLIRNGYSGEMECGSITCHSVGVVWRLDLAMAPSLRWVPPTSDWGLLHGKWTDAFTWLGWTKSDSILHNRQHQRNPLIISVITMMIRYGMILVALLRFNSSSCTEVLHQSRFNPIWILMDYEWNWFRINQFNVFLKKKSVINVKPWRTAVS